MKKYIVLLFLAFSCMNALHARKGFDREIKQTLFVPKGTWMGGVSFSYMELTGDDYKFLVLDDMGGEGYTFKVSPYVGYFIQDNIAVGARFNYNRTYADIGNIDIDLGDDLNFNISDYKYLEHQYTASGFLRTYMGLGNSKIFGFFNEVRLTYGYGQGKTLSGTGNDQTGTYQTSHHLQIGSVPGLTAFVMNNVAVEVSINLIGLDFKWAEQVTNQVEHSSYRKSSANFKVNIFSINIGVCTYF